MVTAVGVFLCDLFSDALYYLLKRIEILEKCG